MQFLALTSRDMEQFSVADYTPELIEAEAQRVRQLLMEGTIRQIWRRGDIPGACLLLEAANEVEARSAISTLPLAQRGMLKVAVLTNLIPYPGFGPRTDPR